MIAVSAAEGSVDYQTFFENLAGWTYQYMLPNSAATQRPFDPGNTGSWDYGDFYLGHDLHEPTNYQPEGTCGERNILFQEVAHRLSLSDPQHFSQSDFRTVDLLGMPAQGGHTVTEINVPLDSSGTKSWELFDSTFGLFFTQPGQTAPLSLNLARGDFPNVSVMQATVPAGQSWWEGQWSLPSVPYTYGNLNVDFPSSLSAGANDIMYGPPGTIWANLEEVDIERTYFMVQANAEQLDPYSTIRYAIDLTTAQSGAVSAVDNSSADVAASVESLSNGSVPSSIAGATGLADGTFYISQFVFRSPDPTAVTLDVTTLETNPLLFADLDSFVGDQSFGPATNVAMSTSGNTVSLTFEVLAPGSLLTLYTPETSSLHFDQIQWNGGGDGGPSGVQALDATAGSSFPVFLDMSAGTPQYFPGPQIYSPEVAWIGTHTYNYNEALDTPYNFSYDYVPQIIFFSPVPTTISFTMYWASKPRNSLSATEMPCLSGTNEPSSVTVDPTAIDNTHAVFTLSVTHAFTTLTLNANAKAPPFAPTLYMAARSASAEASAASGLFFIDGNHQLWLFANGQMTNTGGFANTFSAGLDANGYPECFFLDGKNELWRYDNGKFTNLGAYANRIAASQGALAITDGSNQLWSYSDATRKFTNTGAFAMQLVAGADFVGNNYIAFTDASNRIWERTSTGKMIDTGAFGAKIQAGQDAAGDFEIWFTDGNNGIYRFDQGKNHTIGAFGNTIRGSVGGMVYFLDGNHQIWALTDAGAAINTGAFGTRIGASGLSLGMFFTDGNNQIWEFLNGKFINTDAFTLTISCF